VSPRQRSKNKRGWPSNLYERNGYYSWRSPIDGVEHGLGRDRAAAFAEAVEANIHCAGLSGRPRLIDRLTGSADRSVGKWDEKYQGMLAGSDFAVNTLKAYKSLGKRMVSMLGADTALSTVTALRISEGLTALATVERKARLAQALRNFMRDSFREAKVQGWFVGENPVGDTRLPVAVTVKRSRLTLETYQKIRAASGLDWLHNAMDLALVTGQRRDDIACARFADFRDGGWYLVQRKGGKRLFIPLELRLSEIGLSLSDVLSKCRRTGVVSPFVIHQTVARGNSPRGRRIWVDTLSHRFADAVKASGLDWSPKEPPTFHEIRSLSERLYAAQGGINTQELLGHSEASTTAMYHDSRGSEWTRIKVPV
jgi:enterobacteria phage integrase